tara:strand:- start:641 stop:1210 length:570 start_codon:yes stop_codon:yes gene_type:complete
MLPPILARKKELGYPVFDGQYDLNIVGIRKRNGAPNRFDDMLTCTYRKQGQWIAHYWAATTDPGQYYLLNPLQIKGTAILCPGHYPGVWEIGMHAGKYEALCQRGGEVTVWRDANRDGQADMNGPTDTGFFGINCHKSGSGSSTAVNRWSAGCQVFANESDFEELMRLARMQIATLYFESFSYTLLEEW